VFEQAGIGPFIDRRADDDGVRRRHALDHVCDFVRQPRSVERETQFGHDVDEIVHGGVNGILAAPRNDMRDDRLDQRSRF
jgi:hypothetical protein